MQGMEPTLLPRHKPTLSTTPLTLDILRETLERRCQCKVLLRDPPPVLRVSQDETPKDRLGVFHLQLPRVELVD